MLAVAILAFGAGGPLVRDAAGGGRTGYAVMGLVGGVVIGLGMLAAWWGAPRRAGIAVPAAAPVAPRPERRGDALRLGLATLRELPAFRRLLSTFVLQALATGAMLAGAQYVATYSLGSEGAVTFLFAALVAPALLVMPLATRLSRRVGKRTALTGATTLFAVAALSLLPMRWVPGGWVYVSVALAGAGVRGDAAVPAGDAARRGRGRRAGARGRPRRGPRRRVDGGGDRGARARSHARARHARRHRLRVPDRRHRGHPAGVGADRHRGRLLRAARRARVPEPAAAGALPAVGGRRRRARQSPRRRPAHEHRTLDRRRPGRPRDAARGRPADPRRAGAVLRVRPGPPGPGRGRRGGGPACSCPSTVSTRRRSRRSRRSSDGSSRSRATSCTATRAPSGPSRPAAPSRACSR